ncbi:uncharacterized protein MONOS_17705 [Monocercomonoides exilis]|uniref:uncharacterized protein n=1 Tax=Monocercomonoides exilis TaxID=2049356 RepID=UPI0035593C29|nr:hypothetical protein MONOS_17705 [Monocercomonoides exilis]
MDFEEKEKRAKAGKKRTIVKYSNGRGIFIAREEDFMKENGKDEEKEGIDIFREFCELNGRWKWKGKEIERDLHFLFLKRKKRKSQTYIQLCFSTSYGFHNQAVLNGVNEVNGRHMKNGNGRGEELFGSLRTSSRSLTIPRSEEREAHVQREEAKTAELRS